MRPNDSPRSRRLTDDFAGWLGTERFSNHRFFHEGLFVLDASVLLDLYRVTPQTRHQVLDALNGVSDRLWVPHQAAIEFSRNRRRAVEQRTSSFREIRQTLQAAAENAVNVLESAVSQFEKQRQRNAITRPWSASGVGLDRPTLLARLKGVMDPVLAELKAQEAEYDLKLSDMQGLDPVLSRIDALLSGRIGPAYAPTKLRALVEEAQQYRFPNQIPPGYLDVGKRTPLLAAGDFILWNQTIDRALEMPPGDRLIALITSDVKDDWWELDSKDRPKGPRPELVQELRDLANADLLLLTLSDFLDGASAHLSSIISDQTIREIEEADEEMAERALARQGLGTIEEFSREIDLLELSPLEFERLIGELLIRMGYEVTVQSMTADAGIDFVLTRKEASSEIIVAVAKRWHGPVGVSHVQQLAGAVLANSATGGLLITTGKFSRQAEHLAGRLPVALIDGEQLRQLLAQFGYHVHIGNNIE